MTEPWPGTVVVVGVSHRPCEQIELGYINKVLSVFVLVLVSITCEYDVKPTVYLNRYSLKTSKNLKKDLTINHK